MYCQYDDNWMETEYINVTHVYNGIEKKYYNVPRYKCNNCGYARVSYSVCEFMDENINNDLQRIK